MTHTILIVALFILIINPCYIFAYVFLADTVLRESFDLKWTLLSMIPYTFLMGFAAVLNVRNSPLGTLNGLAAMLLIVAVRYRYPLLKTLLYGFFLFVLSVAEDLLGSVTLIPLLGPDRFEQARTYQNAFYTLVCNVSPTAFIPILALLIRGARRILPSLKRIKHPHIVLRFVRPILLTVVNIWVFEQSMDHLRSGAVAEIASEVIANYALMCLLLITSLTYILQDIRYIHQTRRNETLEKEKEINDALLTNLRTFRHNIANMLYGFEGLILSGQTAELQDYYRQTVRRCALINNENIVMLQRVPSNAVVGLLLHHIDEIGREQIPLQLYTDRYLNRFPIPDADLCQVMGILLDNAREAAKESPVPYISMEMRNAGNGLEIVIRNSFSGEVNDLSASTKPGHTGLGLVSARGILAKYRAYLNIRHAGPYMEAQILVG